MRVLILERVVIKDFRIAQVEKLKTVDRVHCSRTTEDRLNYEIGGKLINKHGNYLVILALLHRGDEHVCYLHLLVFKGINKGGILHLTHSI